MLPFTHEVQHRSSRLQYRDLAGAGRGLSARRDDPPSAAAPDLWGGEPAAILGLMWLWRALPIAVHFSDQPGGLRLRCVLRRPGPDAGVDGRRRASGVSGSTRPARRHRPRHDRLRDAALPRDRRLAGQSYPAVPVFGVAPSAGDLHSRRPPSGGPLPLRLLIVPLLWSLVGGSAAFLLQVPQDWALLLSGILVAPRCSSTAGIASAARDVTALGLSYPGIGYEPWTPFRSTAVIPRSSAPAPGRGPPAQRHRDDRGRAAWSSPSRCTRWRKRSARRRRR